MRFFTSTSSAPAESVLHAGRPRSLSSLISHVGVGLLVAGGLLGLGASARADSTLTLDLPPSQNALDAQAAQRARAAANTVRTSVQPRAYRTPSASRRRPGRTRSQYPWRGGSPERVVGRLGQLDRTTHIYRAPGSGGSLLTIAPSGTYVAIQQDNGAWLGVLMADGSTGWLRSDNVRRLDYQVVSNESPMTLPGTSGGDIYPSTSSPLLTTDAQTLLNEAYKYLGVRYVWGGNGYNGIDCSGFVKNVFGACGYRLPRTATEQMAYGLPIPPDQLQPGDRLYFGHKKNAVGVTHTGIYIGNGYFIHSSSSRGGVAVSRLSEAMFARIYVCARR